MGAVAAENSGLTAASGRPWLPGQSGNPGGRPKGLAALVRERTKDGAELVDFMYSVFRGRRKAPMKVRMEAAAWLADRGFGRVPMPLEHSGDDGAPIRHEYHIVFDE